MENNKNKIRVDYIELKDGNNRLDNAFDFLFEEVSKLTKVNILEAKTIPISNDFGNYG